MGHDDAAKNSDGLGDGALGNGGHEGPSEELGHVRLDGEEIDEEAGGHGDDQESKEKL